MVDKKTALKQFKSVIDRIESLKKVEAFSGEHTKWLAITTDLLENIFGKDSRYFRTFIAFTWRQTGQFIIGGPSDRVGSTNPQMAIDREHHKAYLNQLDSAKGLIEAAYAIVENTKDINALNKKKDKLEASNLTIRTVNLAEKSLRKVLRDIPTNEKIVQDAFENLLIGAEIPYSREAENIEYSSKTYIPDFVIKDIQLPVEIKLCNRKGREKELIAEINDDILAYQKKYKSIFFIIYDLGIIRDVDKFSNEFIENQNIILSIVKN